MHYFDPNVAAEYGIAEAVIINHLQFWISYNKRSGRNENEGRTWTYQSNKAMTDSFPYMSPKTIWSALDKLCKAGVIMKGNFNAHKYDRTLWYAFVLEEFWIKPVGEFHFVKSKNANYQDGEPIPDNPPDINSDNKQGSPAQPRGGQPTPPKSEKKRERKAPGAGDVDWQRWVDRYEDHIKTHNGGVGHNWTPVQLGPQGLKGIRKHLVKISTKFDGKSDDDCGYGAWCFVLDNWEKLGDDWLQGQFDLTVILKKITDILNRVKNGATKDRGINQNGGAKLGTSEARAAALANY